MCGKGCCLSKIALGLAIGIISAFSMILMGMTTHFWGYGSEIVALIGTIYIGYDASWLGMFVGGVYGFVDGFIGGFIIAWLYNMAMCCGKSCGTKKEE